MYIAIYTNIHVYTYICIHIYIYNKYAYYIYIIMHIIYIYIYIYIYRGNLLVKKIELPTRFTQRLLQGSILCTKLIMIFLFIIVLFDFIFQI